MLQVWVVGIWVVALWPVAKVPLWQVEHTVMLVWAWSNLVIGFHLAGNLLWQLSHRGLVVNPARCFPAIPLAFTPSWQLVQPLVIPEWSTAAPSHLSVLWQLLHSKLVTICVGPLPLDITLLWQLEQVPSASRWSNLMNGLNHAARPGPILTWHFSHTLLDLRCVTGLGVARIPFVWHCTQLDVTPA